MKRPLTVISARRQFNSVLLFALIFVGLGIPLLIISRNFFLTFLAAGLISGLLLGLSLKSSFPVALYSLLILMIVFLPALPPIFGDARWRFHQILLMALWPFIIFLRRRSFIKLEAFLALFGLAIILSLFMGLISGNPPLWRDALELAKPGFWWLILIFGLSCRWSSEMKQRALWILLSAGAGIGLMATAQYFDWGGINSRLTPLYAPPEAPLRRVVYRAVGTFANPNRLGLFMAATLCIALVLLFFSSPKKWQRWILMAYIGGTVAVILMTVSRFSYLGAALGIGGVLLARFWYSRSVPFIKILMTASAALIMVVVGLLLMTQAQKVANEMNAGEALLSGNPLVATLYRFEKIPEQFDSNARRVSDWKLAWRLGLQAPIFGVGPSKGIDEFTYFHSEYLLVFRRYGFVGLFAFLIIYGYVAASAFMSFRAARAKEDKRQSTLALSIFIVVMIFAVHGVFSNTFASDFQISAVLWWLIGLFYGPQPDNRPPARTPVEQGFV